MIIKDSRMIYTVLRNGSPCGRWNFLTPRNVILCPSFLSGNHESKNFTSSGKFLEDVESHPYLGVEMDNRLNGRIT